jgi:hypothetical protein
MRLYYIIFFFAFTINLSAQNAYFPLSIGDRWSYGLVDPGYPTYNVEYKVTSDTIMPNGRKYAVYAQTLAGTNKVWYPSYLRQDNNKVYIYNASDSSEYLMYDFSRKVGDTVGHYIVGGAIYDVILSSTGVGTFWDSQRRTWSFGHSVRNQSDGSKSTFLVDSIGLFHYDLDIGPFYFGGASISGKIYGIISDVSRQLTELPQEPYLNQNFPNPFNGSTTISYSLPNTVEVNLELFDLLGRRLADLVHQRQNSGYHSFILDTGTRASGIYLVRLTTGRTSMSRSIIILK